LNAFLVNNDFYYDGCKYKFRQSRFIKMGNIVFMSVLSKRHPIFVLFCFASEGCLISFPLDIGELAVYYFHFFSNFVTRLALVPRKFVGFTQSLSICSSHG